MQVMRGKTFHRHSMNIKDEIYVRHMGILCLLPVVITKKVEIGIPRNLLLSMQKGTLKAEFIVSFLVDS